jgi:hypothetical protein
MPVYVPSVVPGEKDDPDEEELDPVDPVEDEAAEEADEEEDEDELDAPVVLPVVPTDDGCAEERLAVPAALEEPCDPVGTDADVGEAEDFEAKA